MSEARSVHFGDDKDTSASERSKRKHYSGGASSPHRRSPAGSYPSPTHWSSPTLDLSYRLRHRTASPTDNLRYAYTPRKHQHHRVIAAAATQVSGTSGGGGGGGGDVTVDGHHFTHNGGRRLSKLQNDEMRVQQILKGTYQHPISPLVNGVGRQQQRQSASSPASPNRRVSFASGVGGGSSSPPLGVLDKQASIVKPTPFRQAMMKTLTPGNMQVEFLRNLWEQDDRDKEAQTITKLLEAAEQRKNRIREDRRRRRAIIAKVKANSPPDGGGGGSGGGSMTLYSESISSDVSNSTDDEGDRTGGMSSTQQLLQLFKNKAAHRHEQVSKKLISEGGGGSVGGSAGTGSSGLTGLNAFLLDRGGSFATKDSINVSRIEAIAVERETRLARDRYGEKWSLYHLKEANNSIANTSNHNNNVNGRRSMGGGNGGSFSVGGGGVDDRVPSNHMMRWADEYLSSTFDGGSGDGGVGSQDLMASFIGGGDSKRGPKTPRRTAPLTPSELQQLYKSPAANPDDGSSSFRLSPSSAARTRDVTAAATGTSVRGVVGGESGVSGKKPHGVTTNYPGIPFVTVGSVNSSANSTPALRPAALRLLHNNHHQRSSAHTAGEVVAAKLREVRPRGSLTTLEDPRSHPYQEDANNNDYGSDGSPHSTAPPSFAQLPRRRSAFSPINPASSSTNNPSGNVTTWSPPHVISARGGVGTARDLAGSPPPNQQDSSSVCDVGNGSPLLIVTSPITPSNTATTGNNNNINASSLSVPNFRDAFAGNMLGNSLSSVSDGLEANSTATGDGDYGSDGCGYDGYSLEALCRDSTISSALASKLTSKQRRLFNLVSLTADSAASGEDGRNSTLRQLVMEEGYSLADIQALLSVLLPAQQKQYGKSTSAKLLLSALKGHCSVEEYDTSADGTPAAGDETRVSGSDGDVRASHTLSVPFFYAPYRQTKGEAKTSRLQEISTATHCPSSVFTSNEYRKRNQPQQEPITGTSSNNTARPTQRKSLSSTTHPTVGSALANGSTESGELSATNSNIPGARHTAASNSSSNQMSGAAVRRTLSKSAPLSSSSKKHPDGKDYIDGKKALGIFNSGSHRGSVHTPNTIPSAKKVSVSGKSRWGHGSPLTEVVIAGTF